MRAKKLHLAFLWHMHQPYYRNDIGGETIMPWVRLHSLKNYYDIPEILTKDNSLKMTFNLVPSLLLQIENLTKGVTDSFEEVARVPAAELPQEQKMFLLKYFFMVHPDIITEFPRFASLWEKRGRDWHKIKDSITADIFETDEYRDLQVLYHLAWCGWELQSKPVVKELIKKGSLFTEEDKKELLQIQKQFVQGVIPLYRSLKEKGRIEISTSPFYHPILPLLIDQRIASISTPGIPLPSRTVALPKDASTQIENGIAYFEEIFGSKPAGIWPSEGSVSDEILELAAGKGFRWAATDDEILKNSIVVKQASLDNFLKPYIYRRDGKQIILFFRHHYLSDKIGFTYSRMEAKQAAADFILSLKWHLDNSRLNDPLLSVILDGENAWEFFNDNGEEFLEALTASLGKTDWIETETFSSWIDKFGGTEPPIEKIHPGSWIYGNFTTWIGHAEKNRAWELLLDARVKADEFISEQSLPEQKKEQIMNELMIAEGSDWFWWYGDDHQTEFAAEFDAAFRQHLINVYLLAGREPPAQLLTPVFKEKAIFGVIEPVSFLDPTLNGYNGNFFEWRGSGSYNPSAGQGAIHRTNFCIKQIRFGFNLDYLFLRIETAPQSADQMLKNKSIEIGFASPLGVKLQFCDNTAPQLFRDSAPLKYGADEIRFGCHHILELGIRWNLLGLKPTDKTEFNITLKENGNTIERHPINSNIALTVPDESFEERNWMV